MELNFFIMPDIRSNLIKSKWHAILRNSMGFGVPVIVLLWQSNHLSLFEVTILQSVFSILMVILEIPSGYFADLYGRKNALIIGSILMTIGTILLAVGFNFFTFLLAEIFVASGIAMMSGADSALVYDTLLELKEEKKFKKIWSDIISTFIFVMIFMNAIGGWLADINLRYAFYVIIPFMALSIPLSFSFKEPKRHELIVKKDYFKKLSQVIHKEVFLHPQLITVVLFSAFLYTSFQFALWFYNPYFELTGLDIFWFGFVFAFYNLVAAISSKYSHALEEKWGKVISYLILLFILILSHGLMGFWVSGFSFLFAAGQQWARGFHKVVIDDYVHGLTRSEIRATVLSVNSMISRLFYSISLPLLGWLAGVYTVAHVFQLMAIITTVLGVFFFFIFRYQQLFKYSKQH